MSEYCSRCIELETEIELLRKKYFQEIECMKNKLLESKEYGNKLRIENEKLSLDLAFYNKDFVINKEK